MYLFIDICFVYFCVCVLIETYCTWASVYTKHLFKGESPLSNVSLTDFVYNTLIFNIQHYLSVLCLVPLFHVSVSRPMICFGVSVMLLYVLKSGDVILTFLVFGSKSALAAWEFSLFHTSFGSFFPILQRT